MQEGIGIRVPEIMLPDIDIDLHKWSVIACDQYTSDSGYWDSVAGLVGDAPSTLHLIYPEAWLDSGDMEKRIRSIASAMRRYMGQGILKALPPGFIYVERKTSEGRLRKGLIAAIDLEMYDYNPGASTLIRATEGTVVDRLPPRIRIRKGAPLEVPHVMVLIDDPGRTVIEPLSEGKAAREKLYDFELMQGGGHIAGYLVDDGPSIEKIFSALKILTDPEHFRRKYDLTENRPVVVFAVGDGNHSLATAKACWEELKAALSPEEQKDHPARYALVELVNVHDEGLAFEPIHRVLFNVDPEAVLDGFRDYLLVAGMDADYEIIGSEAAAAERLAELKQNFKGQLIRFAYLDSHGLFKITNQKSNLEVGTLQPFLDKYLAEHPEARIDYIHGDKETFSLSGKPGNLGFLLPAMEKRELFRTVILDGILPRKTFSMGEANEKRFYLECRKISR